MEKINNILKENAPNVVIIFGMINYYLIHIFCFQNQFAASAFHDDGWLSLLNIFLILMVELFAIYFFCISDTLKDKIGWFCATYVLQIYAMREADFHRIFTADYHNVDNIKLYTDEKVPLVVKLTAAVIFFPFFAAFGYLIIRYGIFTVKEFFKGRRWSVAFALWGGILLISQILDKSKWNDSDDWRLKGFEEILEVTAAIYILASVIFYALSLRNKKKGED